MSPFSPAVKKSVEERLKAIMTQGFTAEELYETLNHQFTLELKDLRELLDEKVKDGTFTVSAGPLPRYKLASKP